MSQTLKINLSYWLAVLSFVSVLLGGVWVVAARDNDIRNLQAGHQQVTRTLEVMQKDRDNDHELLIEIRRDVKWLSSVKTTAAAGGEVAGGK